MVSGKDPNTVDTQDPVKSTVPNYGYSLRKGDFAQRPMSMKKFLEPFDHSSLTNTEAGEKYAAYKASFIRQQLEEFFERNKAHAWFREKYHPDYCTELSSCTKLFEKRLEIFMEFYKNGYLNNLHLTSGYESEIVRLLDMVAIKLAGGTEEDFILLDKLNEDQNSNDFSMIIEESSHQQERNYEASNNGVQSSEVQQAQQIQKNSDKKLTKKAKPKTGSKQNSKSQRRKESKVEKPLRDKDDDEEEEGEDSSLSEDEESNSSGSDSANSHSRSSDSSSSSSDSNSTGSSSSDSSDDDSSSSSNSDGEKKREKSSTSEGSSDSSDDGTTIKKRRKKHSKISKKGVKSDDQNNSKISSATHHNRRHHHRRSHHSNEQEQVFTFSSSETQVTAYHNHHQSEDESGKVLSEKNIACENMPLDSEESNRVQTVNLQSKPSNSMDGDDDNGSPKPMDLDVPSEDKPSEGQLRESTVNEQTRRPIHYTTLLFLPHIPFNTFKRDLVSVFSTSPYFLRLAVLDPVIMPDTKSSITDHDQIFGTIKNAIPKILLKRMGWASFASQYKDDTTNKWITVDLTAIRSKLIQHAIDCDAPSDLIDCLRLSRPIIEHLKVPHSERARNTGYLFNKLLSICPTRIRSKALVRRHLVIAAHVIYQLDKARGLWSVDCNTSGLDEGKESRKSLGDENKHSHEVLNAIDDGEEEGEEGGTTGQKEKQDKQVLILNKSSETTVHSPSYQGRVTETDKLEQSIDQEETMGEQMDDSELKDSFRQKTHQSSLDEKQLNDVSMNSNDHENKNQNRNNTNLIDPGDDLIKAANILNNIKTINPFLQGLTDFLVDEGSAEEELLLMGGMQSISFQPLTNSHASLQSSLQLQKFDISSRFYESDDSELLVALDRLILYLRIVHSVDFYAPALYMNEDLMPHPCHLMHIRPSVNEITKALAKIKGPERTTSVESVDQLFASQLKRLVRLITPLTENDCKGLGFRSVEEVVEDFIKLNTRRKKRKTDVIWVCPLSNKKFRDPIYVKKHILNKHMDKIEAIKKDNAYFFNNYLMDPARPQLPSEPRFPRKRSPSPSPSRETVRESSGQNNRANERERSVSWTQGSQRWQQYGRSRNDGGNFGGNYGRDNLHSSVPYYPRPYGRQQYSNFRMPYGGGNQRSYHNGPRMGNGYSNFNRRGFPRRSYIDLDAP